MLRVYDCIQLQFAVPVSRFSHYEEVQRSNLLLLSNLYCHAPFHYARNDSSNFMTLRLST